mgnify:CR=1 FL=1
MQEKTQGVVLRTLKYNDNSLIVDIYTATRGTVSFMVKLPKSRKATLKGVFFRPLSILEIDFDYRQKSALQRIRDVRFDYTYQSLPYDPYKSSIALFLGRIPVPGVETRGGRRPALFLYTLFFAMAGCQRAGFFQLPFGFHHAVDAFSRLLSQCGGLA